MIDLKDLEYDEDQIQKGIDKAYREELGCDNLPYEIGDRGNPGYTEPTFEFVPIKTYVIDMEKVIQSDDVNSKINAIMDIFVNMNLTIQDFAMTDSLRKYCKEK